MRIAPLSEKYDHRVIVISENMTENHSDGSAIIEFVVIMALFIPLASSVPLLGKYFDFKQKNIDSSRYAAWERTVWSDPLSSWNDNEVSKSDRLISHEADQRYFGNEIHSLTNRSMSRNVLWRNGVNKQSLIKADNSRGARVVVSTSEMISPIKILLADNYSYKGFSGNRTAITRVSDIFTTFSAQLGRFCKDLPGIGYKKGMNLGDSGFATIVTSSTIKSSLTAGKGIRFQNSSAILSNAWSSPTEDLYKKRISKLVIEEPVKCLSALTRYITYIPLYQEGKDSLKLSPIVDTSVLLSEYRSIK